MEFEPQVMLLKRSSSVSCVDSCLNRKKRSKSTRNNKLKRSIDYCRCEVFPKKWRICNSAQNKSDQTRINKSAFAISLAETIDSNRYRLKIINSFLLFLQIFVEFFLISNGLNNFSVKFNIKSTSKTTNSSDKREHKQFLWVKRKIRAKICLEKSCDSRYKSKLTIPIIKIEKSTAIRN